MVTMLAAIPTHLDESNSQRVKRMAKVQRSKCEREMAQVKGKLHLALNGIKDMQAQIGKLKQKQADTITEGQALSMVTKDDLTALSQSLTQELFDEPEVNSQASDGKRSEDLFEEGTVTQASGKKETTTTQESVNDSGSSETKETN
jgi:regulator of replication initiation timing